MRGASLICPLLKNILAVFWRRWINTRFPTLDVIKPLAHAYEHTKEELGQSYADEWVNPEDMPALLFNLVSYNKIFMAFKEFDNDGTATRSKRCSVAWGGVFRCSCVLFNSCVCFAAARAILFLTCSAGTMCGTTTPSIRRQLCQPCRVQVWCHTTWNQDSRRRHEVPVRSTCNHTHRKRQ